MRRVLFPVALTLAAISAVGCTVEDLCGEYVTYMCDCHDGGIDLNNDPVDCTEYETVYQDADADLQVYCQDALDAQIDYDAQENYECPA